MSSLLTRERLRLLAFLSAIALVPGAISLYRQAHAPVLLGRPDSRQATAGEQAAAIQKVLTQQAADWNRGDLDAFARGYKNAPDILFIGHKVSHGYQGMLAGYKQSYNTPEKMGTLTFSQLEVQPLDAQFATATGHFHLERTAAGGGDADGYFLLVLEDTAEGWKIVRDDTTALPVGEAASKRTGQP